ncbi:MAG: hypothetical protein IT324_11065 [Anaerolineae bacterium]|nr:hypothetical protein [Anaerolineae bacterium]
MTPNSADVGRSFWLKWILITTVGNVLGALGSIILVAVFGFVFAIATIDILTAETPFPVIRLIILIIATFVSLYIIRAMQWRILRQHLSHTGHWVSASVLVILYATPSLELPTG